MPPKISVIGHRGFPAKFADNSLPGFLAAAPICDRIELDVRRSGDGKLVLAHDPSIGGLEVSSNPWSLLAEVDLGDGVKPCLLDEAIAALPGTPILIEIKNTPGEQGYEADSRLALEAAARVRKHDALVSFNWGSVEAVRRAFPDVSTGLIVGLAGSLSDAIEQCLHGGHEYLLPDVELVGHLDDVFPDVLTTYVWSSQRFHTFAADLPDLVSSGVSGIITDDPLSARNLIEG